MHFHQIKDLLGGGEVIEVTPGDTEYDPPLRGVRVAVAGDLAIVTRKGGSVVVVPNVMAGETFLASIYKVVDEGTEAQGLTGYR